jgi:hypothetical protein
VEDDEVGGGKFGKVMKVRYKNGREGEVFAVKKSKRSDRTGRNAQTTSIYCKPQNSYIALNVHFRRNCTVTYSLIHERKVKARVHTVWQKRVSRQLIE